MTNEIRSKTKMAAKRSKYYISCIEKGTFLCPFCPTTSRKKFNIQRHIAKKHADKVKIMNYSQQIEESSSDDGDSDYNDFNDNDDFQMQSSSNDHVENSNKEGASDIDIDDENINHNDTGQTIDLSLNALPFRIIRLTSQTAFPHELITPASQDSKQFSCMARRAFFKPPHRVEY